MFLKFIKRHDFLSFFLTLVVGVLFWYRSFQVPPSLPALAQDGVMPLYKLIMDLLKGSPQWQVYLGFAIVALNCYLITRLSDTFVLFKKGYRLPGIIYLVAVSSWGSLQTIHPVHLAVLCIIAALFYIFSTYQKELEIPAVFNASFLLAFASMFYLPAAILLPIIWISIFILQRSDNWRLLVAPFFGFLVPWLILFSIAFMNDTLGNLYSTLTGIIWAENGSYILNPLFLIISAYMIFIVLLGSFSFLTTFQYIKVSSRKYFIVFYWMLAIIGISAVSFSTIGIEVVALATLPAAFLISIFFLSGEKLFWKEIIFLIFILLFIFNAIHPVTKG